MSPPHRDKFVRPTRNTPRNFRSSPFHHSPEGSFRTPRRPLRRPTMPSYISDTPDRCSISPCTVSRPSTLTCSGPSTSGSSRIAIGALQTPCSRNCAKSPNYASATTPPYRLTDENDHGVPMYAEPGNIPYALIEIRQDLIDDESGQEEWAARLGRVLRYAAKAIGVTV